MIRDNRLPDNTLSSHEVLNLNADTDTNLVTLTTLGEGVKAKHSMTIDRAYAWGLLSYCKMMMMKYE